MRIIIVIQPIRTYIDEKAAVFTGIYDTSRKVLRERPHWSSGYTVLDFYNSFISKRSREENVTLQGILNGASRITRNDSYSIRSKTSSILLPPFDSIDAVTLIKNLNIYNVNYWYR